MFILISSLFSCQNNTDSLSQNLGAEPQSTEQEKPSVTIKLSDVKDGDILITEIMHDPVKIDDFRGEWIEIYNNSDQDIDLQGLIVRSSKEAGFQIEDFSTCYL